MPQLLQLGQLAGALFQAIEHVKKLLSHVDLLKAVHEDNQLLLNDSIASVGKIKADVEKLISDLEKLQSNV